MFNANNPEQKEDHERIPVKRSILKKRKSNGYGWLNGDKKDLAT